MNFAILVTADGDTTELKGFFVIVHENAGDSWSVDVYSDGLQVSDSIICDSAPEALAEVKRITKEHT